MAALLDILRPIFQVFGGLVDVIKTPPGIRDGLLVLMFGRTGKIAAVGISDY